MMSSMRIRDRNWMQIEEYLRHDDRAVLPLGSTEQHAYLSLCVDAILSEAVAVEAAEPLGVPVFPAMPYGPTPSFMAYPGTVSLSLQSYLAVMRDVLDSLAAHGFRRLLIVNGHGGNQPVANLASEWMAGHSGVQVRFHNWWNAPKTWAKVVEIDPVASHASWMENFARTRVAGAAQPAIQRPMVDFAKLRVADPRGARALLGDGNFGGYYEKPDPVMDGLWKVAVEETRALLADAWG
jgi:creatinine amidohydrolase